MVDRHNGRIGAVSIQSDEEEQTPAQSVRQAFGLQVTLEIAQIKRDPSAQPRAYMSQSVIDEYAEEMVNGAKFPPVVLFRDRYDYWLADGFHRVAAAEKNGYTEITVDIKDGTLRDAILYSLGVNASHGLRRTAEDKRRSVTTMLLDDEWKEQPVREIARQCHVSVGFVSKVNSELASVHGEQIKPDERQVTRNGKTFTMNTGKIGADKKAKSRPKTAAEVAPEPTEHDIRFKALTKLYSAVDDLMVLGLNHDANDLANFAQGLAEQWGIE